MIFERDVVKAVCVFLENAGYQTRSVAQTRDKGDDIVAEKLMQPLRMLYVEAKGESSSIPTTKRYGKAFDSAQVRVHVAEAFYRAASCLSIPDNGVEIHAGIALPETKKYRQYANRIQPILDKLGIAIFWVDANRQVEVAANWPL